MPWFHEDALLVVDGRDDDLADDAARLETGEWEVRGDARAETRFRFRTGITSVVPWLVVFRERPPRNALPT